MNWLTNLRNQSVATISGGIIPKSARSSFRGEIVHGQWSRKGGDCMITEDAFVNPDKDSPIAAMIIGRMVSDDGKRHTMDVQIITNTAVKNADAILKPHTLGGLMYMGISGETLTGLQALGVNPPSHSSVVMTDISGNDLSDEASRDHAINRTKKVFSILNDTDALSKDPAIREAFLAAIQQQFAAIRILPTSHETIEHLLPR